MGNNRFRPLAEAHMKKIIISTLAAILATMSLASVASADSRNRNDDEWRPRHHDSRQDSDRSDRWRHADRRDDGWRHDRWRQGWRHDGWRGGYWGGPRVIITPRYADYCFIKKVRHYDRWGNLYIKRVRVCR